jgi:hypothetical protein
MADARRRSRPEIIRAIYRLLRSRALRVESAPVVYRALSMFASGASVSPIA